MGYTTEFNGSFKLNRKLTEADYEFLQAFNETRHNGESAYINTPGIWCGWTPSEDKLSIERDTQEKFYKYVPWIKWLITNYLAPKGYVLNGVVAWCGEESDDVGRIVIVDNIVTRQYANTTYEDVSALLKEVKELRETVAEYILLKEGD